ncbi:MAG TPA: hypothetical protein VMI31_14790, partial [Fimbriimonadaceae bacterium]|nr:hypothetical protein [Fimbriimonadaceae bacterium]
MLEAVAFAVAIAALAASAAMAARIRQLAARLEAAERALAERPNRADALEGSRPALPESRPLEGLRVALAISQDHDHAPFVTLLKEQLFGEDVTDVSVLGPGESAALLAYWPESGGPDLLIDGQILCNSYAEIYYEADLTCRTPSQALCTIVERPPHGDRPVNLAHDLIARIKNELEKL